MSPSDWASPLSAKLEEVLSPKTVRREAPLSRLNTLRVGGPAEVLVIARTSQDVAETLRAALLFGAPLSVLGLGSNVIIPDEGFRGVLLKLVGSFKECEVTETTHGPVATIGAGMPNAHAVRDLNAKGIVGLGCVALVPGTIGGAIAMNAGTRHGEISGPLIAVEVALPNGELNWIPASELQMSYRTTHLPTGAIVTRGRFNLQFGDVAEERHKVATEKAYRATTQPFKLATNGSVFRNPSGDYAGRLIDACDLKGERSGGAIISPQHANWIVNEGDACARDVLKLIRRIQDAVQARFDVTLEPEVRWLSASETLHTALLKI